MDGLTDFERGWAAHNLYDMTAGPMYKELLPWPAKDLEKFNYVWCYLTALKVIEDIVAYSMFGSELPQLQGVGCSIRPMNEDADKLARYYEGLRVLYADRPSMQAYGKMLLDWGAAEEVCEGVIEAAERIDSDERLKKDVLKIYGKVLDGL
ncbi:MAG: hypothetical protein U9Q03_03865 [Patescibacteria group bacterium]|nr:hypothetical protein [Patescibacteria group bacterium]